MKYVSRQNWYFAEVRGKQHPTSLYLNLLKDSSWRNGQGEFPFILATATDCSINNPDMCFCSPWGVFEVDVENMRGVERGLDWVLHHLAKKRYKAQFTEFYPFMLLSFRRDWSYHSSQGKA